MVKARGSGKDRETVVAAGADQVVDELGEWFRAESVRDPQFELAVEDANCRAQLIAAMTRCRRMQDLSQKQVAGRMDTTQSAVSELEAGDTDARLSTLQRYARAVDAQLGVALHFGPAWTAYTSGWTTIEATRVTVTTLPVAVVHVATPVLDAESSLRAIEASLAS